MKNLLRFAFPLLALGILTAIYVVKYETWQLKREARRLETEIAETKKSIAQLRAEWAYLIRPDRIERLAREHLKMRPAQPDEITVIDK